MTDTGEVDRRTRHFGTVTASLSHDLGNVLATVQEAAGLLGDYVSGAADGEMIDAGLLEPIAGRIDRSIARGLDLVRLLNWIAHSIDDAQRRPDLLAVVEKAAASASYFARQQFVEIEVDREGPTGPVGVSAMDLHLLVFSCLRYAIDAAPEGATVKCTLATGEGGRRIGFAAADLGHREEHRAELLTLVESAGVRLEWESEQFALLLPDVNTLTRGTVQ